MVDADKESINDDVVFEIELIKQVGINVEVRATITRSVDASPSLRNKKEQVRAKLRSTIRRLLLQNGYPPDQEERATQLVLAQAEVLASAV